MATELALYPRMHRPRGQQRFAQEVACGALIFLLTCEHGLGNARPPSAAWKATCTAPINASSTYESFVKSNCPTREQVDMWLENAGGTKEGYFKQFEKAIPLSYGGHLSSQLKINSSAHVCFFGDSMGRELFDTWGRVAPDAPLSGFTNWKASYHTAACSPLHSWDHNSEKILAGAIEWFLTTKCDTYFVTGLGPHCIRRPHDPKWHSLAPPKVYHLQQHKQLAEIFFQNLTQIAVTLDVPVVFVSSPIIEADILNLAPAKGDAMEFHDMSLPALFAMGEAESFNRIYGARGEKAAAAFEDSPAYRDAHAWPQKKLKPPASVVVPDIQPKVTAKPPLRKPFLRFYDLARFHRDCPGFRCDGMHVSLSIINKTAKDRRILCRQQDGYADYPFLAFLQESGLFREWQQRGLVHPMVGGAESQGTVEQPIVNQHRDCSN